MATYYWVGGTGTWDNATSTKWASTSGGAGGAGIPTSADDVIFDSASNATGYTVTVGTGAVCKSMTVNGPASGTVTFSGSATWTFYGSITLAATGVSINCSCPITLAATTTGNIITTNGVTFNAGVWTKNGSGDYTLGSALTLGAGGFLLITAGTFSTNNFNLSPIDGFSATGGTTNLGSSTVSPARFFAGFFASGSSIINAGTSKIIISGSGGLNVEGRTLYEVDFNALPTNGSTFPLYGVTLTNLKFRIPSGGEQPGGYSAFVGIYGDVTVTGTLSTYNYTRPMYRITLIGMNNTVRTITASSVSISNLDFLRITAAGTAAPFTGNNLSNRGDSTNITFTASKTVYWNLSGSQNWDAVAWANTSGGTPNTNNDPLLQDTAIIDNAGAANTITLFRNGAYGAIDASGRTTAWAISMADNSLNAYGNLVLGSAVSGQLVDISFTPVYSNNLSVQIPLNVRNVTFTGNGSQTVTFLGAFTATNFSSGSLSFSNMGINTSNYSITSRTISITAGTQTVNFGNSTITCTGEGTVFTMTSANLSATSSTISLENTTNSTSQTFSGGNKTYGTIALNGGSSTGQTKIITGNNILGNITTNKTVPWTLRFAGGSNNSVNTWSISGTSGNVFNLNSTTASLATLTYTGNTYVSFDYANVYFISGRPANYKWFAGTNSTDSGFNSAVYFTAPIDPTLGNFLLFT